MYLEAWNNYQASLQTHIQQKTKRTPTPRPSVLSTDNNDSEKRSAARLNAARVRPFLAEQTPQDFGTSIKSDTVLFGRRAGNPVQPKSHLAQPEL